jgi:hypothetical protein
MMKNRQKVEQPGVGAPGCSKISVLSVELEKGARHAKYT